jgi:ACS family allantoate permease-like MFS transporter
MADDKVPYYPDMEKEAVRSGSAAPLGMITKHAKDADEAMKAFVGLEGEILVLDEATNKRLLRKIDLNILPVRL